MLSVLHPSLDDLVFQVIAICAALAVVPTAILLVSFTEKNMVFENIARFTHAEFLHFSMFGYT